MVVFRLSFVTIPYKKFRIIIVIYLLIRLSKNNNNNNNNNFMGTWFVSYPCQMGSIMSQTIIKEI
ncbi:MAG: hypothetical protein N7Q72_05790, partial [Spiroplasma sp. Tabriz.8]|nr:hypothetical protein [Spiroplasma sp. Tabriz.8]